MHRWPTVLVVRAAALCLCATGLALLAPTAAVSSVRAIPSATAVAGAPLAVGVVGARHVSDGCGGASGLVCKTVDVPLDRSGAVPGTIPLHVEILPGKDPSKGAVFLLAGGPGQGSAQSFALGGSAQALLLQVLFPGYTLVAYDDRGTGDSAPLSCPVLASATSDADVSRVVADCAAALGPGAAFYRTVDHAADLDAVRAALGFDRIVLFGVSYGTRQALVYASTYPTHVSRLVLDSIESPRDDRAFATNVLEAMPATLAAYCADGRCARATPHYAGDVAAVANALAADPASPLSAGDFMSLVLASDLDPGLAAELPAAVHAARAGDLHPLLHAFRMVGGLMAEMSGMNEALQLATVCDDGPFPWQPNTTVANREAAVQSTLATLPAGAFGPFGSWAAELGAASGCVAWPASGTGLPASGTLPDVPVLALSGGLDLRTPTAAAARVVSDFPQGHLLVVPGVGHSVLTSDTTLCAVRNVRAWMQSGQLETATCPRGVPFVPPLAAFPSATSAPVGARAARAVAAETIAEAETAWLATAGLSGRTTTIHGIHGGEIVAKGMSIELDADRIAPGVSVSGRIRVAGFLPPLEFTGSLRVSGGSARGELTLDHGTLRGTLVARGG